MRKKSLVRGSSSRWGGRKVGPGGVTAFQKVGPGVMGGGVGGGWGGGGGGGGGWVWGGKAPSKS